MSKTLMLHMACLLGISGCDLRSHSPIADGGACTYQSTAFQAKIVSVKRYMGQSYAADIPDSDDVYRVGLVCDFSKDDTLYLNDLTRKTITKAMIENHHLDTGKIIEGALEEIQSGHCTPKFYHFNDDFLQ